MRRKSLVSSLILTPLLCLQLLAQEEKFNKQSIFVLAQEESSQHSKNAENCGKGPHPAYVTMRHIEANGIGYNQGYTTLEGFFHTNDPDTWVPFLDVRGHLFNNGKPAANVGVGCRRLTSSRIWGINTYYDYRKAPHQSYNQISLGLESLGEMWDFRINGYLPVGRKTSHLYGDLRFAEFKNHYAYISQKVEFAMKGVNAEVGAHVNCKDVPIYVAAGPYYLEGQGKVAWGAGARVALDVWDYVRVEGNTSYDNVFKWIGQGQISVIIPFGTRKEIRTKKGRSCKGQMHIAKRAVQRVDRMEIIPVDTKRKRSPAIDPATGQPYFFWFVNSGGHSNGTFESPFPTLDSVQIASHPNDVIYVYPGNYDTVTISDGNGITLQDNQKLFGAGIDLTLPTTAGTIRIPSMASGLPAITNSGGVNNVTCGNNNEIAGIYFNVQNGNGIGCFSTINAYIHDNTFDLFNGGSPFGISLVDVLGQITILNNQMNLLDNNGPQGISITITSPQTTNYLLAKNTFINNTAPNAFGLDITSQSNFGTINSINNQFTNISRNSIAFGPNTGSGTLNINENTFSGSPTAFTNTGDIFIQSTSPSLIANVIGNVWVNTPHPAFPSVYVFTTTGGATCLNLQNNTSPSSPGYVLNNHSSTFTAEIANNVGTVQEINVITTGTCP